METSGIISLYIFIFSEIFNEWKLINEILKVLYKNVAENIQKTIIFQLCLNTIKIYTAKKCAIFLTISGYT